MLSSDNEIVQYMSSIALHNAQSPLGGKFAFYRYEYDINFVDSLSVNVQKILLRHKLDVEKQGTVYNICTLFDILKLECDLPGFENDQIQYMLNDLLVN